MKNHYRLSGGTIFFNTKTGIAFFIMLMVQGFFGITTNAQIGTYTFTGSGNCPNTANSVTTQPTGATFSNFANVGSSCIGSSTFFENSNWNQNSTIDLTEYNAFSLTANTGYLLALTSISFQQQTTNNNSVIWEMRSSIDNYTSTLSTGPATTTLQTHNIALNASFTNISTVTFRLYLMNMKNSGSIWKIDNVSLFGNVNRIPANPGDPTSNSPQCNPPGVTITRSGTPPSGVTWYWQTVSGGTSTTNSSATYVAATSGTYYLRARDNTSLYWSLGEGSVSIAITPPVSTPVITTGANSTRCQGAGILTYTATATNTTGITYTLDAASVTGGNSINLTTGSVTWATNWNGSSVITASAAGCAGPKTATHTVTITPTVGKPEFSTGENSTRCQGSGTVTYTAGASNSTSMVYSLNASSTGAGNTINSTTGAVTFVAGYSGISIITATASGCNGPSSSIHTATITPYVGTPAFATGTSSTRCQGSGSVTYTATAANSTSMVYSLSAPSLTAGNTINSATGEVIYIAGYSGTSYITATAMGCGPNTNSIHTAVVTATVGTPYFILGAASTRCQGAGSFEYETGATNTTGITYSLDATSLAAGNIIDETNGELSFVANYSGTIIITASAAGCNGPKTVSHTVTITPTVGTPVFTSGATSTRCQGAGNVTYTATATNNTGLNYSLDATSLGAGNTINSTTGEVSYSTGWSGSSIITISAAGCNGPKTATHIVTVTPTVGTPVFSLGATSLICQGAGNIPYTATATNNTGLTYSLDATSLSGGNTINSASGLVTFVSGWSGTTIITASAAGCNGPKTATHTVTVTPTVGTPTITLGATTTRCQGAGTVTYTATATNNTGITYSLDAPGIAAGNTINSATGAVSYNAGWSGTSVITASASGCNGPSNANHTVTIIPTVGSPVFALGTSTIRCQGGVTTTYNATATNNTGITYSLDAASLSGSNSINSSTGAVTWKNTWVGTSTITASATGCNGPITSTHTVTTTATVGPVIFAMGSTSTVCQNPGTITYSASATTTSGITYTLSAASLAGGNTIDANTGAVTYAPSFSGTSIVTASAAGCSGPTTATHTVTITASVGTPVFSLGSSSTRCQAAGTVNYSATATTNTGISYSLDATSIAAGNSINSATGLVTYLVGYNGTSIITATATGCNGPASSTHTITTTPYVGTPVYVLGESTTRCQGAGNVTYLANATDATSITYILDNSSKSAGNSIDLNTGVLTWVSGWSGTSTITASAAGCSGPKTATHVVTTTATVGTPVFSLGATSTRCRAAGTVTYTATATTNTAITYSLDAASLAAGNTINSANGAVTFAEPWDGSSIITASATGCNGPSTSTHTVTITPYVLAPEFNLGSSTTRCQAGVNVTYIATATYSTSITYSIDAASLAAVNSINSSTGVVTYKSAYSGITYITATANGCGPSQSSLHTATTTATVGPVIFAMGSSSTVCQNPGTITYSASATTTSGITYTLSAASLAGGNTINANTGAVTYAPSFSGTSIVTASAAGCSGPTTATHTATITATVGTPVFSLGSSSTRCQAAGTVTYSATSTTNTGISYSLDATSIAAGNSINSATGLVTYLVGYNGTSIITATATGCNGPASSTHTITTTPYVGTPVFAAGASSTRCQGNNSVGYTATANYSTGITYSIDAASTTGGNTINAANGMVTWAAGWIGNSTITASAAGCSGPKTATHNVTNTVNAGTPTFVYGASSLRCPAAGTVSYAAIATNAVSVSYTLDAASLSAGNSINANTGDVTYVTSWSGISTITGTANGCGNTVGTHTATSVGIADKMISASPASVCNNTGSVITVAASQTGVDYTLRDNATNSIIAGPFAGTGGALNFNTGNLTAAKTFNVLAELPGTSGALSFDGVNDFVKVPNAANLNPTFLTLECWVKINAYRAWSVLMVKADPTSWTNGYGLTMNNAGNKFAFFVNGYSNGFVTSTTTAALNTWYHVAATYDGVRTRIYVNGVLEATTNYAGTNGSSSNSLLLGGSESGTLYPLNGIIDEARLWNTAISATQIQNNMNRILSGTETNLVAYYSMENGTGSSLASDFASGNNNGTLTNMNTSNVWVTRNLTLCSQQMTVTPTVTITPVVGVPVFAAGATSTRCQGVSTVTYNASATNTTGITYTLNAASISGGNTINSATGTVTFAAGWVGNSTITASAAGCSGPSTATHTVTTTATVGTPVFALGATSTRCRAATTVTYAATATTSTGMSYSLDATSLGAGNTINTTTGAVTFVNTWEGTSVITATATGCNGPKSANHTVTITAFVSTPVFAMGSTSVVCQAPGNITYLASANNTTGITYSLDGASLTGGNTINATTGQVNYAAAWNGTTTITASAAGCSGPQTATHTVSLTPTVSTPVFAMGATSSRCQGTGNQTYTATANNNTGITYSLDGTSLAAGNTINTTTGEVSFIASFAGTAIVTASASGCNGPRTGNHTITVNPPVGPVVFNLGASSTRCQGAVSATFTATATTSTGISYALDATSIGAGNTINSATGSVTFVAGWLGTSVITATASGCGTPTTGSHSVTSTPSVTTPVFSAGGSSIRCQGVATITYAATATNTTGITYTLDAASISGGNTINNTTGAVSFAAGWSGSTTITASAAGCNGPKTANHTVTVTATVGTPVFAIGASSSRCRAAGSVTYTATATTSTGMSYSLDASSVAAGNSINTLTGEVTFVEPWEGTSIVTATATGCNGPRSSNHTITVTSFVQAPVFAAGTSIFRCKASGTTTYTATAANSTGITYTLDLVSRLNGNSINAATGAVSFSSGWTGTSTVTATATGCGNTASSTLSIYSDDPVTNPSFLLGSSSSRCLGAGSVTYNANASNVFSWNYSLDATSLAAGNTINAANGTVTYTSTWSGTSVITATATGCSGPKSANHTVTINPAVGPVIFSLGETSNRCRNSGDVTYTATATSNTGITYSLDLNSRNAGNSISSTSGKVSYTNGWVGTSYITVTANGCNGPSVSTHVATSYNNVSNPVFDLGNNSVRCQSAGVLSYSSTASNAWSMSYSLDLTNRNAGNTIDASTGTVTFVESWSGTSTITVTAVGCNGPRTTNHTVTTTAYVTTPVFSLGATTTRCQASGTVTYSASASNASSISYSLDAASLTAGNTISTATGAVTYVAGFSGTSTITVTANGCSGPLTATHTVTVTPVVETPVFSMGNTSTRCQGGGSVTYAATATNATGITYALDASSLSAGNTIVGATGAVTFVASWSGTSVITATAAGCSPKTGAHTVTITPTVGVPVFSLGASSTRCQGTNTVVFSAAATNQTGMSYALDASSFAAGNTINAATGAVTFIASYLGTSTITATAAGCNGPASATHSVTSTASVTNPVFGVGSTSARCQGSGTITYAANASYATDMVYSLDGYSASQGNLINSANGAVTYSPGFNGTLEITASAIGCNGPLTSNHTVTITPTVGTPVFDLGTSSGRCKGAGTFTYLASAANTTGITYSLDAGSLGAGNTINTSTGAVTFLGTWSGTTVVTASAQGCNGPDFANHTITVLNDVSAPVFNLGATSTRCQAAQTETYTATAANSSGIAYSLDAGSRAVGNTINSSTGAVTFLQSYTGSAVVTATANGCGPSVSSTHTVTITTSIPAPVFTMGGSSSRCNGPGTITYTATASTAITYSIDITSINAGNTINSSTGALTFSTGWVGITTVTAAATGCGNPSSVHNVNNTPSVGDPVFNGGSSSSRCQGAGSSLYVANATNATSISYSLDAASLAAGNSINAVNGVVTYVASWTSPTTITVTASGCNGPTASSHLVSISPNGTPAFVLGTTSTRNQGVGSVTYNAAANNGGAVTYSLDSASLAAGNTINTSTGAVSYAAIYSGTSVIRASCTGCNGAVFSLHTVTITPSSVFKHLYLSDPSQALDRIDPVATSDNTTAITSALSNGGSTTFTQAPVMCSQLVIKTGRNITITSYVAITSGTMPASPAITAVLRYGATNIITLGSPTYNSSTQLLTWTGTLGADVTVPAGQAIALTISSAQSGVSFTIHYDSQTKPSKIEIPVSTFIDIVSLDVYNATYPGGSIITGGVSGSTYYIRATVTDPFGFADITALNLTLTPPGSTVAATSVATAGCTRTYQYVWNSPATATYVDIAAVAKEGYENTVSASRSINFSNCINCPPVALNDSAVGAGGIPIIVNVLANDSDPNNDINVNSLKIITAPQNGNAIVANGKVVYLPNGTFAGTDEFTYQICDLTSPTPLCATATVKVTIDPTIVDPCSEAGLSHIYYVPFPEDDARQALIRSTQAANLPMPTNNIRTIISVKIPYPGMVLVWDHWEDGYETNILSPTQSTTQVWGDGNPYNGIAPGYPNDIIPAGGSMVFDNTMNANPRVASSIFYDGKDKVYSSGEITLTQVLGEPSRIGVQAMKTNIAATSEFGKSFTIPVGENFNSQDFRYTALFIRATENNTEVNIDKDNNGTFETTTILNEGQSLLVDGGVLTGATVTGSAPIGVDLHFGGVDNYSSREVPIFPATWYSNVYYTPVPTTTTGDTCVVMLYNNLNRPITINWSNGAPASGNINLAAKTVVRFPLANSTSNAYKFVNPTGESFTAIEIVDSYTPGGGGNSGSTYDWSFNLIAEERLTTFATIAWAPGSTDGTRNDNPIWVTPAKNTTIYVKYNGEVLSGGLVSPCGFRYDVAYTLNALKYRKIFDATDNDQSGIAIYTCDGTKIAAAYGEDAATAVAANPSWDVGTTIKPYCAQKLIFANDDYAYSLTDRSVTIPVLNNDAGFTAVIDPATLSISGLKKPKYGTVSVNSNGTLLYTPNPGYIGLDSLEYSICSTPVPVCDIALVIIQINGCPTPANQNIISGQVFLDVNKDGISNDGKIGFSPVKVYFYADGNCNGLVDANELKDSVTVDASGGYQFITYPERTVKDDFSGPGSTLSCASGTDGNTPWLSDWVDAGDASVGFCVTPVQSYGNTDVEMMADGAFGNALRLKDRNRSATRTVNLSGATAAYLSFSYRRAKTSVSSGKDIYVQLSTNGSTFTTIFTILGTGVIDAAYVPVYNQDILSYANGSTTFIRFLTNGNFADADEVFIDDVLITYLRYPMCYITALDLTSIQEDFYVSTANRNALTATNGGSCLFPFDYGIAKKIITISGTLFNDGNGLTDNLVNGIAFGAPSGNTVYAYLVNSLGKVAFKTTVSGATGTYSFPKAEVSTNYILRLSTTDVAIGANPPASANLPVGWVMTGDSYGLLNKAGVGIEAGLPDVSVAVNTGLFNVTNVNFGVQQRPTAGNGYNTAINPGFTNTVEVPASTFWNTLASSDPTPGNVSSIRIAAFPAKITSIVINGISYTAATFPPAGVIVPATSTGQPTQLIRVDPINGMVRMVLSFYAIDNAGFESLLPGTAMVLFLLDTDKDGIPDNIDIDDDNDGIPDVIEVCGNGATSFACAPGGKDPADDEDNDGIVNWQDADYGPLNANGCNALMDKDGDGVPDFLDLDSDNDGIPDVVEAFGADANGDGVIDNFTDTDGDGLSQNVDANNTGAAGSGNALGFVDIDGDGVPNSLDLDSDGDGLPDIMEVFGTDVNFDGRIDGFTDADFDGLADSVDADADNDFIMDNPNGPLLKTGTALSNGRPLNYPFKNADYVGRPNPYDLDSDGDGVIDVIESGLTAFVGISNGQVSGGKTNGWANSVRALGSFTPRNSDGRGPANYLDIDSDDDGITDNIEAQSTAGFILPGDTDTDNDGIADVYDISINSYGGNGLTPYDNDGDGTPDYFDTDTDNDGAPDLVEASKYLTLTQANINSLDTDGDGLLDEFDLLNISQLTAGNMYRNHTNSNFGALGSFNGPLTSGSNAKMTKSSVSMSDRDWRNIVVLPIQIVSFNGTFLNNLVTLKWSVQNESLVNRYEVERSANGIDFIKIGTLDALNRDNSIYTYPDDISSLGFSHVYYRVRQFDKSGQSFLTNVKTWKLEAAVQPPMLYPNPVQNDLKIRYYATDNLVANVMIFNGAGQVIMTTKFGMIRGQNILTIPRIGSMSKGSYTLRFQSGLNTWMLRFMVQ